MTKAYDWGDAGAIVLGSCLRAIQVGERRRRGRKSQGMGKRGGETRRRRVGEVRERGIRGREDDGDQLG